MSAVSGDSQHGPKVVEGAFVSQSSTDATPLCVAFQYNPASLRRSLAPQTVGRESSDRSGLVRVSGAPVETITLDIEIDGLGRSQPSASSSGVAPQLAALELLAYPKTMDVTQRQTLLAAGSLELAPNAAPAVFFVWGSKRVLPVRVTGFQITEELFDQELNPIRAMVSVTLEVLTYSDVAADHNDYSSFLSYQQSIESLASPNPRDDPTGPD